MIYRLNRTELHIVHELAHEIWPLVYSDMISAEQMTYMLEWMYAPSVLVKKLDAGDLFFSYRANDRHIGYLHVEPLAPDTLKIQKLYVHPEFHGRGIGRTLIDYASSIARERSLSFLALQVNRSNPAVQFYKRLGFTVVEEKDFDIGGGYYMNDFVMRKGG